MLTWISYNLGTILVLIILATIIAAIIFKLTKDKKKGVRSCGCNCSNCPMNCPNSSAKENRL